jgi:hypothetical protein
MRWVTRAKFAAITGISRKSVSSAVARGDVTFVDEGGEIKIDLQSDLTKNYMAKFKENNVKKGKRRVPKQAEPEPDEPEKEEQGQAPLPNVDLDALAGILGANAHNLDRATLDRLKAIEQIRAIKQKTDQARLKLIDRALVAQAFAKIYAVDVNEFRTLGANISPVVGSIAGVDRPDLLLQIEQAVNAEVFKVLGHVKRIINDFLKSVEAEKIK